MIKVTLEFHTVPEAIIALNAVMNLPQVKISEPAKAPEAPATKRKGRNDKGKTRGPHQAGSGTATPAPAVPAGAATTAPAATPQPAAPVPAPEQRPVTVSVAAPDAAVPTQEQMQQAMEKVFAAKGIDAARTLLADFAVGRIRDIKGDDRPKFMAKAAELCK